MNFKVQRLIALAIVLAPVALTSSAQSADPNAYLYIAHAASGREISSSTSPSLPVDVAINGNCLVKGLAYGDIIGPLTGPASGYTVQVSPASTALPCSNAPVLTAPLNLAAGTVYMGIILLDGSNNITGQVYPVDLSPIPAGQSRVMLANATQQDLSAYMVNTGTTGGNISLFLGADSIQEGLAPSGEYTGSIFLDGSDVPSVGPMTADFGSENLYFYILAGSANNNSVQLIGPKVIRGVF